MKWLPASFFADALSAGALLLATALCSCQSPPPKDSPLSPAAPQPVLARVSGTVQELRAALGNRVQAGEWVATLQPPAPLADPARLRETLKQREADLARARNVYLREKQRVEGGQTFEVDLLPARRQAFEAAQAARHSALADLESTQREVERLRHYAPCAGRVVGPAASIGDTVRVGTPLLFVQPAP